MASAVIQWLAGLFDDVTTRIRPGITWTATSAAAPLDVQVRPADRPAMSLHLGGDGPNDLRSFATALQQELNPLLGTEAPPCPTHGVALEAVETDKRLSWRCKEGDFTCAVGEYRESLWPPGPEEPQENLGSWLGHRLRRRGLMHGVAQWSVSRRDGALVGYMALRPSADESAIRGAAAPVVLDVTHIGAVATVREVEPAGDGKPARRTLRLSGEMPAMRLARLQGILRRPAQRTTATSSSRRVGAGSASTFSLSIAVAVLESRSSLTTLARHSPTTATRSPAAEVSARGPKSRASPASSVPASSPCASETRSDSGPDRVLHPIAQRALEDAEAHDDDTRRLHRCLRAHKACEHLRRSGGERRPRAHHRLPHHAR